MKQMKILGVIAVALTLGLTACGGNGGKSSKHQHSYGEVTVVKAATCEEAGEGVKKCKVCGEEKKETIKALGHDLGEATVITAATCTEAGKESATCKRCNKVVETDVPAKGHTWGEWVDVEAATCTAAGSHKHTCSVCNVEESEAVEALGHDWSDWVDVEAATCTVAGSHKRTCSRCNQAEVEAVAALGHHLVLKDDGSQPAEGKAKVRIYECDREGCDYATFGFKATEVSANAGRLVDVEGQNGEIGKRFWGRPIGNAMVLGDDGSASGASDEKIFDRTVQGDLFEYIFDLSQEQINTLGDAIVCYADATPADYMGGMDFWACDPSAEEWTPGYYIDNDHEDQTPIADYRYILYVDDQPVQFDSSMKAPVPRGGQTNLPRGEFLMPYVFHFAAGEHKISLRMAGGYRSVFWNFTFRSYEEPAKPDTPVEPAAPTFPEANPTPIDTSAWTAGTAAKNAAGKDYTPLTNAGKNGVKIAFADVSSGSWDGSKLPSAADSGVTYQIKAAKAGLYQMIMTAKTSSSGNGKTFTDRGVKVTVNGFASQANVYGARTEVEAGMNNDTRVPFVLAIVNLTGNEDSIYIENRYYRIDFDSAAPVIFAEI